MIVSTKKLFEAAYGKYAIGAYNINNLEQTMGLFRGNIDSQAPFIIQISKGARSYSDKRMLEGIIRAADEIFPESVFAVHLDHGDTFELCKSCIDGGFTSVMIDGSHHSFDENVELTKRVVEYAHAKGAVVEGELGRLAGIEDAVQVSEADSSYTRPEEVEEFVARTGVDSLAIAIGTSHGAFKFKPGTKPQLRFDILDEVTKCLPGFPIVLHGASSVMPEFVKMINDNGGNMPDAIGVPEDQLRQAARSAVCKINIDSDLRLAMTGTIRQYFAEHPDHFDPRQYLKPARENIKVLVQHKLVHVLGCAGKA